MSAPRTNQSQPSLAGWFPALITRRGPAPQVVWMWTGTPPANDPFLDLTLTALVQQPLHALLQRATSLDALLIHAETLPDRRPDGLILHTSRCGSTLVARMLGAVPGSRVLSEPATLTALLEDPRLDDTTRRRALRALVRILAWSVPEDRPFCLKLDARNLLAWPRLAEAFPTTPLLALRRDPVEVLVSNLRQLPAWLFPGELHPRLTGEPPEVDEEEYAAFLLGRLFAAYRELAHHPRTLALDYTDLPGAVATRVVPHFGLRLSESELAALHGVTHLHAKVPGDTTRFTPDSAQKQQATTPAQRAAVARWMEPFR